MADTIEVQFGRLEDTAKDLKQHATAIADLLKQLDADVAILLQQWTGAAADAFAAQYRQWSAAMLAQAETLDAVAGILMVVRNRFFSIEGDVKDHWVGM